MAKKKEGQEVATEYIRISPKNKKFLEDEIKPPERTPNDVLTRIRKESEEKEGKA